jgi:hypothetical protein
VGIGNGGDAVPAADGGGKKAQRASYYGNQIDLKIEDARRALGAVLDLPVPSGMTIGSSLTLGNKVIFALQVLDGETEFEKQTITLSVVSSKG